MSKEQRSRKAFAEVLAQMPLPVQIRDHGIWPRPIHDGVWTDSAGTTWHLRGDVLPTRKIRTLLADPAVEVLLFYGPEPAWVSAGDREALWERMSPVLSGFEGGHQAFRAAEFLDSTRQKLLVIEESC
jgi:hypothetical protein